MNSAQSNTMKAAELFDLTGRIALVTGASSGLGNRFARTLAANGAKVACLARRKERIEALVDEIRSAGGQAIACAADVADRAAVAKAFDEAEHAFGTVDILINNAGVAEVARILEQTPETWRRVLDVNLDAVYYTAQIAGQRLQASAKPGVIVNIASVLGFGVSKGLSAYATAKAAVIQLTRSYALELARFKIRVNAIAPGYVVTEINEKELNGPGGEELKKAIPLRRFGDVGDLDGVLLLLASDAGRFITGATYVIDGGQLTAIQGA